MARISIVLPTYNGQRYLAEALDSLLAQTFTDWELIVVDDCSSDDTPRLLADYAARDGRVQVIRNAVNRRLPASLNIGFAQATGEYFTWTSDDNRYLPTALATLVNTLETSDAAVVYSSVYLIDDAGQRSGQRQAPPMSTLTHRNAVGACFLYRREVQGSGYREDLFLVEDYEFWLRASLSFTMTPITALLYEYRVHAGSLTQQRQQTIAAAREKLLVSYLPRLPWATRKDRMEGYALLARETRVTAPDRARGYQRQAWRLAPHVMARRWLYRRITQARR